MCVSEKSYLNDFGIFLLTNIRVILFAPHGHYFTDSDTVH